jgi:hypothetical protein
MNEWPRVIKDKDNQEISVEPWARGVFIAMEGDTDKVSVVLSVDQCVALIAAVADAAKEVTGGKS